MATSVPDFPCYLNKSQGVYWKGLFRPLISKIPGLLGTISSSAANIVSCEYIPDQLAIVAQWDGPAG